MDAFSLSWRCFSISLITLITLQLVGYLMLSPWLTVWLGIRLIFPRAFYKQPCVPPFLMAWADVAAEFMTSEALWPHSRCNTLFKFILSNTQRRGQLFEYPQECRSSSSAAKMVKLPHSGGSRLEAMKHYNLWHSLIFRWSHWFPCVRPWQGRLQNSQNVIPVLPRWGFSPPSF